MSAPAPPTARGGVLAMVGATLIWGATFVLIRDILHRVGPRELVFARFAVATATFAAVIAVTRRVPAGVTLRTGVLAGLGAAGCYVFQAVGLTGTSAGSSAFLTCTGTVLAAVLAWPLLRQRPTGVLSAGIVLALAGSALLSWRGGLTLGAGELWTLLGASLYAFQILAVARAAGRVDMMGVAAVQMAVVALVTLPWAGGAARQLAALDAPGWWRFAYLALPATVVATLLQLRAQRVLPAGRIALLFALEPVFALLVALTFGGERFAPRWWVGALLILAGVLVVEWRSLAAPDPRPRPATA